MGMWASARLTYGYDVTDQTPDWWDEAMETVGEPGEAGSHILLDADPETGVRLAHDEYTGHTILASVWETATQGEPHRIGPLPLGESTHADLRWAAQVLGYDVSGLEPEWLLSTKFD